ncbi:MAG: DUF7144 family membrane protein [Nocardioides sp.]
MPTTQSGRSTSTDHQYSGAAVGVTVTAAVFMILIGVFQATQGLVALVNDTFYVVGSEYVFQFDVTTWGWIHLILGIVAVFAGFALFQGAVWGRTVAVLMASVGIILNFMWMPYYPIWSLTVITFNAFVIWAVTAHGRDILQP